MVVMNRSSSPPTLLPEYGSLADAGIASTSTLEVTPRLKTGIPVQRPGPLSVDLISGVQQFVKNLEHVRIKFQNGGLQIEAPDVKNVKYTPDWGHAQFPGLSERENSVLQERLHGMLKNLHPDQIKECVMSLAKDIICERENKRLDACEERSKIKNKMNDLKEKMRRKKAIRDAKKRKRRGEKVSEAELRGDKPQTIVKHGKKFGGMRRGFLL